MIMRRLPQGVDVRLRAPTVMRSGDMSNRLIGVGVIGYGYWGPNLVRNFANNEASRVVAVSDLDPARLALSKRRHPDIVTTSNFEDLLQISNRRCGNRDACSYPL